MNFYLKFADLGNGARVRATRQGEISLIFPNTRGFFFSLRKCANLEKHDASS
jgi:hypothetical protein